MDTFDVLAAVLGIGSSDGCDVDPVPGLLQQDAGEAQWWKHRVCSVQE